MVNRTLVTKLKTNTISDYTLKRTGEQDSCVVNVGKDFLHTQVHKMLWMP